MLQNILQLFRDLFRNIQLIKIGSVIDALRAPIVKLISSIIDRISYHHKLDGKYNDCSHLEANMIY